MSKFNLLPFSQNTFAAAATITRKMFELDCSSILQQILDNPIGQRAGVAPGEIISDGETPTGFQAAILRQLYFNGAKIMGTVGSTLASSPETSPVMLLALMRATMAPRGGSQFYFANTSNPASMKMNRMLGVKGQGPDSCAETRFAVLHWGSFLRIASRDRCPAWVAGMINGLGKFLHLFRLGIKSERQLKIEPEPFDQFWKRYLTTSRGLVCSRTSEELLWAFGGDLQAGRDVMLVSRDDEGINGYIVVRAADEHRLRWRIADWIALDDNPVVLDGLLEDVARWLHCYTSAGMLESIGFNENVQKVIARTLNWRRGNPNNSFIWTVTDAELKKELVPDAARDWFWGPYDGDRFMS